MFTVQQIEKAHEEVKSGADFPNYIRDIKGLGVEKFETWVKDSHTCYFGLNDFQTQSPPQYDELTIVEEVDAKTFKNCLKAHQQGETDYYTFCKDCAKTGIEKWLMDLTNMTCTYFDKNGHTVLVENIAG